MKVESSKVQQPLRAKASPPLKSKAQIRIEVWSDFVCPFCYLEEPVLNRIAQTYGDSVIVDWKAFELRPEPVPTLDPDGEYLHAIWNRAVYPMAHLRGMKLRLPPLQPRSQRAFEAAEFARAQGRFDEMRAALFQAFFQEGRDLASLSVLTQIGVSVGLDPLRLLSALQTGRYAPKVSEDEQLGREGGITGVPTMVFSRPGNELFEFPTVISGAQPYEFLRSTVEEVLHAPPDEHFPDKAG